MGGQLPWENLVVGRRNQNLPRVKAYKVWRRAKIMEKKFPRSGRGLSLDVAILHGVFAVAVENEMVVRNPVRMEGRPGDNPEAGAQPFDADSLSKLRKFAGPDLLAFLLLRWTGLRGSDAVKLTWLEVSLERREIERITQKRRKRVIVPLSAELQFALETEFIRVRPQPTEHVLVNPATMRPMTRPRLYQRMRALGKRSGVPDCPPPSVQGYARSRHVREGGQPLRRGQDARRHYRNCRKALRAFHQGIARPGSTDYGGGRRFGEEFGRDLVTALCGKPETQLIDHENKPFTSSNWRMSL
jgi:integrase